ncbi:proline-, glutamic acid- and leucine-rich protein 1 [Onychostoma macrolepis]|uniref:Proline-, glutamic acid- and leucine-rich protein 1 n=1 Tax=Onychostoma macrolepis TaxID=369639 RepID=A0A7J6CXH6_9TELE|nr:proline-, glutamic acid- and leucine-rich protein 1 [Onychostoma macrolepis]KAF4111253.1 hypothetical protein G5714_008284 [Onychostoma macrolepis]
MASAAWLHGPNITRLTEGLVSVLKEDRPEYLPALLANYREHGVVGAQSTGAVGGLVGISNARLGSSKTRFEGLCLLSVLVKDSSSEVFQQHCLSWLRTLQQVIQSQAPLPTVQLAVSVLLDLLQYSSQLPELAREVGLNSILGILTSLLSLKSECHLAAMKGMTACMIYYPRACGSLREKLGAYFLSKMDSDNPKVQEMACECYGRLPCLGGVLERGGGGRRAEGWTNQLHCLLASANGMLGQLYQGAETEGTVQYEGPGVELPFPPLDDVDPLLILQLHHRYKAVCLAIKHTLSADPASSVRLPVQHVLNFVCRALAVNTKSISPTGEGCLRLMVLPSIHIDTLELLSVLIKAVGGGLVQYSSVLTRLFSQSLSAWTPLPEASLGQQRAYSAVRVTVYRTIELWVRVGGASLLQASPSHTELLFTHLMGDITPASEAVKLRSGQQSQSINDLIGSAGKSGPRRTKGLGMGDGISLQRKGDVLANQDTCVAALRALRQIILTSGTLLKEDLHKRIQDLVVPLCMRLQQQSHCVQEVGAVSGQYGSPSPRRELYRLLLALVLVPSPRWPPPLSCAVSAFSHGRRDHNIMVSSFCAEALTICNTLIHPRTPSISLPLTPLTLKSTPVAPVLASGQNPSLSIPTLLGGPATGPPFPARHPMGLGPATLLGSLENHLPLAPPVLPTPAGTTATPGDLLLSPAQPCELAGLGAPEGQRQVFVRYDKEEPEDVEISLESDSDDSVVIMPAGMMMEMQDGAANAQSLSQSAVPVVGGLQPSAPIVGEVGAVDTSLPNELPTSIPHQILPANANNINSFPGPSQTAQLVSLVPPLNSTTASLSASPAGLADSLTGGPQLQQMLMQTSPGGQPPTLGLSLQMQLQNQIAQTSRQLQQQPPANEVDQNVININSSDDEEEEEEELEEEDELGEEEEEEEGLEDEEEEEEGSDFIDDEYCEDEFEEYEDEEDEDEEESEEIQPLEGDNGRGMMGEEEAEVMIEAEEQQGMEMFCMEREQEVEPGIEEMEGVRSVYADERIKEKGTVEEIENIGAVERNEPVVGKDQIESLVISGDAEGHEEDTRVEAVEPEVKTCEQEVAKPEDPEEDAGPSQQGQELSVEDEIQKQEPELQPEDTTSQSAPSTSEQEVLQSVAETAEEEVEKESGEQGEDSEVRGTKRKMEDREEGESSEQGTEKKKMDEAMASMLADFVDCPPDDDDRGASHS